MEHSDKFSSKFKIAVMISGYGSNLQAIIDAITHEQLDCEICAVVSSKTDVMGLQRAKSHHIPNYVVESKTFPDKTSYDQQLLTILDRHQPDLIVLAGYMRVLTDEFVQHYSGKIINIHPSLLPKYKGLNTYQRVLAAGDTEHGTTIHFVTETLDSGASILQIIFPIKANDTVERLKQMVQQQEHIFYPQVIQWFVEGRVTLKDNHAYLDNQKLPSSGMQQWITRS